MKAWRSRVLARVVLHSVLLLTLCATGFLAITFALLGSTINRDVRSFTQWFGEQACERMRHSPTAEADIAAFPIALAVYSKDGRRLAGSTRLVLPAQSAGEIARLWGSAAERGARPPEPPGLSAVVCAHDPTIAAVVGGPPSSLSLGWLASMVVGLAALVALGSVPLARSLVRPLRELAQVAEKFGRGELSARADITRTDEIGELAASWNAMASNLQAHLLAEKELLANVSHELRTPLARVRVVLETAREDPSRASALLQEIARDLADLERLTEDVLATIRLDFSGASPESSRIRPRLERIDLASLTELAITRCVEANPEREIELEAASLKLFTRGDPALLLRLFDNLLENARKYSSEGIVVRLDRDGHELVAEVVDRGIGIERADLELVFEPFFRADKSRAAQGGSGLGLTLCRRIVEVHGGTITARSEPGVSTTVTVRLPAVDAETR